MATLYRIEIDLVLEDEMENALVEAAREHYQAAQDAWTEESGRRVIIPSEEFVDGPESAFLELVESAFRGELPSIEPQAFRCGMVREPVGCKR